ncbi:peptidyl-prolyl cis-trans isomerase [Babesia ovis]|uniref:Peptidyl-prolyl cis-trans isomerase n=1 Tax=Babesia ovis TaxID=5869 RepID=A0A9W5TB81_BABOV|nr:peptidyl-prolyl cis-trans isomerase [Babesia ovis]
MASSESSREGGIVCINQRVVVSGKVCTVRWRGSIRLDLFNNLKKCRCYRGTYMGPEDVVEPSEETEEDMGEIDVIGVEWDNWRAGDHNGTVEGREYFRPVLACAFQEAHRVIRDVYSNHENTWISNNIVGSSGIITQYLGDTTCSFVLESQAETGISMADAIFDCYICDATEEEFGALECSPHGKGHIGHQFVGRAKARDFFSETSNLLSLGLQQRQIARIGDCARYKFPKIREVYLAYNLIYDWNVVRELISLIPQMDTLDLTGNLLVLNAEEPLESLKLRTLVLSRTMLSTKLLEHMLKKLERLTMLVLCNNAYTELPCLCDLHNLAALDFSDNYIWNWYSILQLVYSSKSLKKLIMTNNKLSDICMDPVTRTHMSLYQAAMAIAKDHPNPLEAFAGLEELYLDENYIYDWHTVSYMATIFTNLRVLRMKVCSLGKEVTEGSESMERQVVIAIFPRLTVLNGMEITKSDRCNAERYYLCLEFRPISIFQDTNSNEGLTISHKDRLTQIHGEREAPPEPSQIINAAYRLVEVELIPDGDSDSFLKPSVKRQMPLSTTVLDIKKMCSKLFNMDMTDIILVFNNGILTHIKNKIMSEVYCLEPPCRGRVILHTTEGELDIRLWSSQCPHAVRNFVQLCLEGYYNNCIFHRIIPQFMVQTGDPTGTGHGGESIYGECFENEIMSRLKFRYRGITTIRAYRCFIGLVGMANTGGKRSNGSQFFITLERADCLNGKYTLFGKVEGATVYNLMKIGQSEVNPATDRPKNPPRITHVEVVMNPFPDIQPRLLAINDPVDEEDSESSVAPSTCTIRKKCLLSFAGGGESDDDTSGPVGLPRVKSAHELLSDPKLSKNTVELKIDHDLGLSLLQQGSSTAERGVTGVTKQSTDSGTDGAIGKTTRNAATEDSGDDSDNRKREIQSLETELKNKKRGIATSIEGHDGSNYMTRKQQKLCGKTSNVMDRLSQFTKRLSQLSKNSGLSTKESLDTDEDLADGSWFAGRKLQFSVDSIKAYEADAGKDTLTVIDPLQGKDNRLEFLAGLRKEVGRAASGIIMPLENERPHHWRYPRSGRRVPFDFDPGDTVAQVKRAIHENERRHLSDELMLKDYKVTPGSTIHMVLQLRGG